MNLVEMQNLKDELTRAENEAAHVAGRILGLKERLREADGWRCLGAVKRVTGRAIGFDYVEAHGALREAEGRCISDGTVEYAFDLVWIVEYQAAPKQTTLEVFVAGDHSIKEGTRFWVKM
jgi:hypothetical protein